MKLVKIILDAGMTILLLLLMKLGFVGIEWHELFGIGIFFVFLLHKILNSRWIIGVIKGFISGKSTARAGFMFCLDFIILLFVTFNVVSGILISQTILTGIAVRDVFFWSNLHHFSAYGSLLLISVHIGLHWRRLMSFFTRILGFTGENPARTLLARVTLVVIAFFGIKAMLKPDIYENFTAPFVPQSVPAVSQTINTGVTIKREEE